MFDQQHGYLTNTVVAKNYPVHRKCPLLFDLVILLKISKDFSNYNKQNLKLLETLEPSALLMKTNLFVLQCV